MRKTQLENLLTVKQSSGRTTSRLRNECGRPAGARGKTLGKITSIAVALAFGAAGISHAFADATADINTYLSATFPVQKPTITTATPAQLEAVMISANNNKSPLV